MIHEFDADWRHAAGRYAELDMDVARFNVTLLSALQPTWCGVLRPKTSMFRLWFVRPEDSYPFPEKVVVSYVNDDRVEMWLEREVPRRSLEKGGGTVTVAADITRPENALPAVEALLLQLATPEERISRITSP